MPQAPSVEGYTTKNVRVVDFTMPSVAASGTSTLTIDAGWQSGIINQVYFERAGLSSSVAVEIRSNNRLRVSSVYTESETSDTTIDAGFYAPDTQLSVTIVNGDTTNATGELKLSVTIKVT